MVGRGHPALHHARQLLCEQGQELPYFTSTLASRRTDLQYSGSEVYQLRPPVRLPAGPPAPHRRLAVADRDLAAAEDCISSLPPLRPLPLCRLHAERMLSWQRVDQTLPLPWLLLWLSLLRRTWRSLPLPTLLGSVCCNAVVISPSYIQVS